MHAIADQGTIIAVDAQAKDFKGVVEDDLYVRLNQSIPIVPSTSKDSKGIVRDALHI